MRPLLQAELLKLRTTRTFAALASVAVGISLLITGLIALLEEPTRAEVLTDVFQADTSSLFIMILAIVGITGEWRHRTITSSLLAAPDRVRFLAAKTIAFAVAGLVLSLIISVALTALGLAILDARELPTPAAGELVEQIARNAAVAALLGAFGVGVGALVRNQAVAIVGILLLGVVIEPMLSGLAPEVERFGPLAGLPHAVATVDPEQAALGDVDPLAPGLAALTLLAWIGAAAAAGAALLQGRDVE